MTNIKEDIKNVVEAAVEEMIQHTTNILSLWIVKQDKAASLLYYNTLSSIQKPLLLDALDTVIGKCEDPILREAGKEIPAFIREK